MSKKQEVKPGQLWQYDGGPLVFVISYIERNGSVDYWLCYSNFHEDGTRLLSDWFWPDEPYWELLSDA